MQVGKTNYERKASGSQYIANRIAAHAVTITEVEDASDSTYTAITFTNAKGQSTNRRYYTSEAAVKFLTELADHAGIKNPQNGFSTAKLKNKKVVIVMQPQKNSKYFTPWSAPNLDDAENKVEWLLSKQAPVSAGTGSADDGDDDIPF